MLGDISGEMVIGIVSGIFIMGYFLFSLAVKDISKANSNENMYKALGIIFTSAFFLVPVMAFEKLDTWESIFYIVLFIYCYVTFRLYKIYKLLIFRGKIKKKFICIELKCYPSSATAKGILVVSLLAMIFSGFITLHWIMPLPEIQTGEILPSLVWTLKVVIAFCLTILGSGFLFAIGLLHEKTEVKYLVNKKLITGYMIGENEKSIIIRTKELKVYELSKDSARQLYPIKNLK